MAFCLLYHQEGTSDLFMFTSLFSFTSKIFVPKYVLAILGDKYIHLQMHLVHILVNIELQNDLMILGIQVRHYFFY